MKIEQLNNLNIYRFTTSFNYIYFDWTFSHEFQICLGNVWFFEFFRENASER